MESERTELERIRDITIIFFCVVVTLYYAISLLLVLLDPDSIYLME